MVDTYREVKPEKSSVVTFSEVIFDRISSNARSRRDSISSCTGVSKNLGIVVWMGKRTYRFRQGLDYLR